MFLFERRLLIFDIFGDVKIPVDENVNKISF
jgi:hypothetical protein